MTKEQLAEILNGNIYGHEIDKDEERAALKAGLVVVFGYSDDNVELRGVFQEELSAYEGTTFRVNARGVAPTWGENEEKDYDDAKAFFDAQALPGADIKAVWNDKGNPCWAFETTIPHATFDIMEDGEKFCRGIVFSVADLPA